MASSRREHVGRRRPKTMADPRRGRVGLASPPQAIRDALGARPERGRTLRARARLELLRGDYIGTENPLLAWEAVVTCRAARLPLPAWALAALADAGERLLEAAPTSRPEDWAPVASALGLRGEGGRSSTFAGYRRLRDAWRLALAVSEGLESGKTRADAVAHVAKANRVSQRAAARAYERLRHAFELAF